MKRGITIAIVCLSIVAVAASVLWLKNKPEATKTEVAGAEAEPAESISPTIAESTTMIKPKSYNQPPAMTIDQNKTYIVTMKTSKGEMKFTLFTKETPVTVNNFVFLARENFYDNTIFHRIIKGFMIQGGDPQGDGRGGPGYKFNDEPVARDYVRGILAMANAGPNTNGSQFFIMHANNPLPKDYVIFGQIDPNDAESFKTLDAIADSEVIDGGSGEKSKPVDPPKILSVTVE
jgi:cyclophilin family peptidyl-prolyl cis-trans isomerase